MVAVYIVLAAGLIPSVVFTFMYASLFPWWKSWEGRGLITSSLGMTCLLLLMVIRAVSPDRSPAHVVWLGTLTLLAAGEWFKMVLLWRALTLPKETHDVQSVPPL